jgi:hypothetical protein
MVRYGRDKNDYEFTKPVAKGWEPFMHSKVPDKYYNEFQDPMHPRFNGPRDRRVGHTVPLYWSLHGELSKNLTYDVPSTLGKRQLEHARNKALGVDKRTEKAARATANYSGVSQPACYDDGPTCDEDGFEIVQNTRNRNTFRSGGLIPGQAGTRGSGNLYGAARDGGRPRSDRRARVHSKSDSADRDDSSSEGKRRNSSERRRDRERDAR